MRSGETKVRFLMLVLGLLLLLGCGATTADPEENPSDGLKIYDVRNTASSKHPAVGTSVTINEAVVISEVFNNATNLKGVFVSDLGGGEYAAILLTWKPTSSDATYGYDPPTLHSGMVIKITGNYNDFCGIKVPVYTHCSQQIELTPYQKEKGLVTDSGTTSALPLPQIVEPGAVKTDAADSAKWQNALIAVDNVSVTGAADSYKVFTLTGDLKVDDTLYKYSAPEVGTAYDRVMGFLYTSYDVVALLPRGAGDLILKGQLDGDLDDINLPDGDDERNIETVEDESTEYESPEAEQYEVDFDHEGLMIVDLQNTASPKHPTVNTSVTLNGVLAISDVFDAASNLKGVMISDVGGGPYAAILLTWKPISASAQYGYDPPVFAKGQILNVVGNFNAFCGTKEPYYKHCSIQVELTPFQKDKGSVVVTSETADIPAVRVLNPALIRTDGAESPVWQSSLVQVENVFVRSVPDSHDIFTVDAGLEVDDQFFNFDNATITYGKNFEKLTGYLFTSYDTVHIIPRSAEDMVVGTQILDGDVSENDVPESETTTPDGDLTENDSDKVDNDATDTDTSDNDLTDGEVGPGSDVTILQLNTNTVAANTRVLVKNAVVTSLAYDASGTTLKGAFIAAQGGGEYNGMTITWRPTTTTNNPGYTPPAFQVGSIVNVEGNFNKFCGTSTTSPYTHCTYQIEFSPYKLPVGVLTVVGGTASAPAPQIVSPAAIKTNGADVAKWQNSLVEVDNVTVLTVPDSHDIFTVTDGLEIDDPFFNYDNASITVGKSYSKLLGFLYISYDTVHIIPRAASDMVVGGTIPDGDAEADTDNVIVVDGDLDADTTDVVDVIDTTDNDTTDVVDVIDTTDTDTTDVVDTTDTDTTDNDTTGPTELTIFDLNSTPQTAGQRVLVKNVVVTSVVFDSASNIKAVFISDQMSGAYRGMLLTWRPVGTTTSPAYTPPELVPGTVLDVEGNFNKFCGTSTSNPYTHCTYQIELSPYGTPLPTAGSVTVKGSNAPTPDVQLVTPVAVKTDGVDVAKWQNSLVEVDNVTVLTAPTTGNYGIFTVTDGLEIDDQFFKYDYAPITVGKTYSKIVGYLFVSYNTVHIIPRTAADLVETPIVIVDGDIDTIDTSDTSDNDTVDGDTDTTETDTDGTTEPPTPIVATVKQIQNPIDTVLDPNADGSSTSPYVQLNNLVVTSDPIVISAGGNLAGVFVSDQGGGEYSGLVVIWKTTTYTTAPSLAKGDVVTVVGTYTEYGSTVRMTEIEITPTTGTLGSITKNSQSVMPPAAHLATPADISTTGLARDAWQGSLVRVENVTVASLDGTSGSKGFLVNGSLTIGNLFYTFTTPAVGDGYTSIQGFLYTASNTFKVMPLAATDLVLAPVVVDGDADVDLADNDTTDTADTTDSDTTPATAHLVLNEIDYDQIGTDATEFVEIYNPTSAAISLTGLSLFLVNGSLSSHASYIEVVLSGSLPAGGYALVYDKGMAVPSECSLSFAFTAANVIQNGDPDVVTLFDTVNKVVVDTISYGGCTVNSTLGTYGTSFVVSEGSGNCAPKDTVATRCREWFHRPFAERHRYRQQRSGYQGVQSADRVFAQREFCAPLTLSLRSAIPCADAP